MELPVLLFVVFAFLALCWVAWPSGKNEFKVVKAPPDSANPVSDAVLQGYHCVSWLMTCPLNNVPFWYALSVLHAHLTTYDGLPKSQWSLFLSGIGGKDRWCSQPNISLTCDVPTEIISHSSIVSAMLGMFLYNWIGDLFKSSRMVLAVTKGINPQLHSCSQYEPKVNHANPVNS